MKLSVNVFIQVLGTAAAAVMAATDVMPPKYAAIAIACVGVIKSITGLLAHFTNPDGTPAEAAWNPDKPKASAAGAGQ